MEQISQEYYDDIVDNIIDIAESIEPHKITILTGPNGSGESVVRQLLSRSISEKCGVNINNAVSSISMSRRTGGAGAIRAFTSDTPWSPTGQNSYNFVCAVLKSSKNRFIVMDELEIGMSDELLMTTVQYINDNYNAEEHLGLLVITHSRNVVKWLNHDYFINMSGMTEDEWVNREVKPVDIEQFEEDCHKLFLCIDARTKKK